MPDQKEPEGNVDVPVQERDPRQQQEEQQQQAGPQAGVAEGKCAQCQATIYLRMPAIRVVNTPETSMLIMPHERPQVCGKCGKGYVPIIRGLNNGQLDIQFSPVEVQQPQLIVPPNQQQVSAIDRTRSRAKGLVIPN